MLKQLSKNYVQEIKHLYFNEIIGMTRLHPKLTLGKNVSSHGDCKWLELSILSQCHSADKLTAMFANNFVWS